MKDDLKKLIIELSAIPGVSGHEGPIARRLAGLLRPHVDEVRVDRMGNVIAHKDGSSPGPKVLFACHSDTIGCIVRSIDERGFLRMFRMGGAIDLLLVGRRVLVNDLPGVIGVRPGHIQTDDERRTVPELRDLYVDVGARSAAEVAEMGIAIGSPIRYHSPVEEMANPDLLCGAYLDNRAGCAALVRLAQGLKAEFAGTLFLVANTNEETGWRGAQMTAFALDPDVAVAIDTTPSGGVPDVDFYRELPIEIGAGPVIQVASQGLGAGFTAHPGVVDWLRRAAGKAGRRYQLAALQNANTDAVLIHMVRGGVPTAALTIPRRYSHSPVEMLDLNDVVALVAILEAAMGDLGSLDLEPYAG